MLQNRGGGYRGIHIVGVVLEMKLHRSFLIFAKEKINLIF